MLKEEIERQQEQNNYIIQMKQSEINNLIKYADDMKMRVKTADENYGKQLEQWRE